MTNVATHQLAPAASVSVENVPEIETISLLHLEDNPADALLMQEYIRSVLPSVSFDTAERLSEVTPERVEAADCVLLDLTLPDASGLEGVQMLRELSEHLPIIVLTGFEDMQLGLLAVRDGADDYLLKNHVDGYTLERAVQYAIERRRLMLQLAQSAADAFIVEASMITAEAASELMVEKMRAEAAVAAQSKAATGTHEVSVRIDGDSSEFVLACRSCSWESDRGADNVHSWTARQLESTLLGHVISIEPQELAAITVAPEPATPIERRSVFRPRGWLA